MSETRKLVAILVADIVGFSRLAGADEERVLARLRTLRSDLIDPTISVHHGRIVKRTGDGSIVEFRSVVDAVRCAVEIQNGLKERNSGLPPEKRIEFRVGIHVGDVVEESDGDLMGDGVNIAARLEGVAKPGGICLSEGAWRHAQGKVEARFIDAGKQRLKNIASPVHAFLWAPDKSPTSRPAAAWSARPLAAALGIGRRIGEPPSLRRNNALIGLLILLTLVGSAASVRFWPVFESSKPARPPTKNLEAYDDYLRAENEGYYNVDGRAQALALASYGKAIELDPNFADAHAGYAMAAAQALRFNGDYLLTSPLARKRAYGAAGRALEIDPNNSRAYVALALLQLNDGRHADSVVSARRAVSLHPNDPEVLANLGMILAYSGEPAEAVAAVEQALRQSPSPAPGVRQLAGVVFYIGRQYERAIEEMKAVSAVWPASAIAHEHLAAAYAHLGKLDPARSEAGAIPDYYPMKTSLAFARLWYERYYKRANDLNHHLEGLKGAGIPEWPFGFEGRPQDQVSGQALATLTVGRTWRGYAPVYVGENTPIILQFDKENRVAYRSAHTFLTGVVRLENDRLCIQFDGYWSSYWLCGAVYRITNANDSGVDYVSVLPDELRYFSAKD